MGTFFFAKVCPAVARTWCPNRSESFFWVQKFGFRPKIPFFCYRTPDFVNDPLVALGETADLPPSNRFFDFSFPSYVRFRKKNKKRPTRRLEEYFFCLWCANVGWSKIKTFSTYSLSLLKCPPSWIPRCHVKVYVSVLLKFLQNSQACKFTPKAGNKVQLHNSMAWWIWEIKVRERMPNHHNSIQIQLRWKEYGSGQMDTAKFQKMVQSVQTFFQRVSFEPLFVYIYAKQVNSCKKIRAKHNETHSKSLIQSWPVPPGLKNPGCKKSNYSFFLLCMPPVAKDFQWHPKSWPGVNSLTSSSFQSHKKQSICPPKK